MLQAMMMNTTNNQVGTPTTNWSSINSNFQTGIGYSHKFSSDEFSPQDCGWNGSTGTAGRSLEMDPSGLASSPALARALTRSQASTAFSITGCPAEQEENEGLGEREENEGVGEQIVHGSHIAHQIWSPVEIREIAKEQAEGAEALEEGATATKTAAAEGTEAAEATEAVETAGEVGTLGKIAKVGGGIMGGVSVVAGAIQTGQGINEMHEGMQKRDGWKVASGGLQTEGGLVTVGSGACGIAAALGATALAPLAVGLGGVAGALDGTRQIINSNDTYEKVDGGAKILGGGLMAAGAVCSLTGYGAAAGVPLMAVGAGVEIAAYLADTEVGKEVVGGAIEGAKAVGEAISDTLGSLGGHGFPESPLAA